MWVGRCLSCVGIAGKYAHWIMKMLNRTIIAGLTMLLASTAGAFAQVQDNGSESTEDTQKPVKKYYMQVVCNQSNVTQKVSVEINMGRLLPSLLGIPEADLRQATQGRTFPTDIDAINFYASKGWSLVDTYTLTRARATSVVYVMMFETSDPAEVGVSILTH